MAQLDVGAGLARPTPAGAKQDKYLSSSHHLQVRITFLSLCLTHSLPHSLTHCLTAGQPEEGRAGAAAAAAPSKEAANSQQ